MSELLLPASLASWPKHIEEWPASRSGSSTFQHEWIKIHNVQGTEVHDEKDCEESNSHKHRPPVSVSSGLGRGTLYSLY
jgi:hypothetical protein